MATSVRLFFENGGTQAYVMRIAEGASGSEVTLESQAGTPVLKVVAREAGPTGANLRVQIDYNTPTPDSTFNMRVFRVNPTTLVESQTEEFLNVSMDIDEPRYVVDVVAQGSQLVTVEDLGATQIEGYTIGALMVNDNSASGIDDAMGSLDGTLRLRVDGDIVDYPITGGDIATPIAAQNLSVQYITIVADTLYLVRIVSDNVGVSVEALPSGQAVDVATILQMGPDRGGIEARRTGAIRPAAAQPSITADFSSTRDLRSLDRTAPIRGAPWSTSLAKRRLSRGISRLIWSLRWT